MVRDTLVKQGKRSTKDRKQDKKTIVCKIYANWCGHCQTLKPVWAELKNLMRDDKNMTMIEIEESEMKDKIGKLQNICKKNIDVDGFPTIVKICGKANPEYYKGERSVDALRAWIMPTKGSHTPKKIQGGQKTRQNKTRRRRN
jgi:thiol-disulfide isomerase/thioredoxin